MTLYHRIGTADTVKALNHPSAFSRPALLLYLYLLIIVGAIVAVWVYAAIWPRFGAGCGLQSLLDWPHGSLRP